MSLADSFLADLDDIEGYDAPSVPVKSELDQPEVTMTDFPSILQDSSFSDFITAVQHSPLPTLSMTRASPDFSLISKSNIFLPLIDAETHAIYKYVADVYAKRFPELEQIVLMPFEYLRVVERIRNSLDLSQVDLSFLPTNLAVAVTVTAATSRGLASLSPIELQAIAARIELAKQIQSHKESVLSFLASRMPLLAPNLNALLGPLLSAQLVAAAGGIENLATMPSQNIEAVGAHKQSLAGMSAASQLAKVSIISQSDLVVNCPGDAKKRALRLVMGKTAIAARVDQFNKSDVLGQTGSRLRAEILEALRIASEAPPARAIKPLPLPAEPRKAKRGGARARKWKDKYGLSEVQKRAGRVAFTAEGGDVQLDGSVAATQTEQGGGRIRHAPLAKQRPLTKAQPSSSQSALAFTASHGIELSFTPSEKKQRS